MSAFRRRLYEIRNQNPDPDYVQRTSWSSMGDVAPQSAPGRICLERLTPQEYEDAFRSVMELAVDAHTRGEAVPQVNEHAGYAFQRMVVDIDSEKGYEITRLHAAALAYALHKAIKLHTSLEDCRVLVFSHSAGDAFHLHLPGVILTKGTLRFAWSLYWVACRMVGHGSYIKPDSAPLKDGHIRMAYTAKTKRTTRTRLIERTYTLQGGFDEHGMGEPYHSDDLFDFSIRPSAAQLVHMMETRMTPQFITRYVKDIQPHLPSFTMEVDGELVEGVQCDVQANVNTEHFYAINRNAAIAMWEDSDKFTIFTMNGRNNRVRHTYEAGQWSKAEQDNTGGDADVEPELFKMMIDEPGLVKVYELVDMPIAMWAGFNKSYRFDEQYFEAFDPATKGAGWMADELVRLTGSRIGNYKIADAVNYTLEERKLSECIPEGRFKPFMTSGFDVEDSEQAFNKEALHDLREAGITILEAPPGAGKTFMATKILPAGMHTLMVAPLRALTKQMYKLWRSLNKTAAVYAKTKEESQGEPDDEDIVWTTVGGEPDDDSASAYMCCLPSLLRCAKGTYSAVFLDEIKLILENIAFGRHISKTRDKLYHFLVNTCASARILIVSDKDIQPTVWLFLGDVLRTRAYKGFNRPLPMRLTNVQVRHYRVHYDVDVTLTFMSDKDALVDMGMNLMEGKKLIVACERVDDAHRMANELKRTMGEQKTVEVITASNNTTDWALEDPHDKFEEDEVDALFHTATMSTGVSISKSMSSMMRNSMGAAEWKDHGYFAHAYVTLGMAPFATAPRMWQSQARARDLVGQDCMERKTIVIVRRKEVKWERDAVSSPQTFGCALRGEFVTHKYQKLRMDGDVPGSVYVWPRTSSAYIYRTVAIVNAFERDNYWDLLGEKVAQNEWQIENKIGTNTELFDEVHEFDYESGGGRAVKESDSDDVKRRKTSGLAPVFGDYQATLEKSPFFMDVRGRNIDATVYQASVLLALKNREDDQADNFQGLVMAKHKDEVQKSRYSTADHDVFQLQQTLKALSLTATDLFEWAGEDDVRPKKCKLVQGAELQTRAGQTLTVDAYIDYMTERGKAFFGQLSPRLFSSTAVRKLIGKAREVRDMDAEDRTDNKRRTVIRRVITGLLGDIWSGRNGATILHIEMRRLVSLVPSASMYYGLRMDNELAELCNKVRASEPWGN